MIPSCRDTQQGTAVKLPYCQALTATKLQEGCERGKGEQKKNQKKITTCLAQRQEKKGYLTHRGATSPYFLLLVLLLGVIDVTDQPIRTREKSIARKKIFFPFKVEASVKAAKFHSYVVGHPIDCKLTVIERDCDLLLGRDMALRCAAHTSHK